MSTHSPRRIGRGLIHKALPRFTRFCIEVTGGAGRTAAGALPGGTATGLPRAHARRRRSLYRYAMRPARARFVRDGQGRSFGRPSR